MKASLERVFTAYENLMGSNMCTTIFSAIWVTDGVWLCVCVLSRVDVLLPPPPPPSSLPHSAALVDLLLSRITSYRAVCTARSSLGKIRTQTAADRICVAIIAAWCLAARLLRAECTEIAYVFRVVACVNGCGIIERMYWIMYNIQTQTHSANKWAVVACVCLRAAQNPTQTRTEHERENILYMRSIRVHFWRVTRARAHSGTCSAIMLHQSGLYCNYTHTHTHTRKRFSTINARVHIHSKPAVA